jgi:hypothetical protein
LPASPAREFATKNRFFPQNPHAFDRAREPTFEALSHDDGSADEGMDVAFRAWISGSNIFFCTARYRNERRVI